MTYRCPVAGVSARPCAASLGRGARALKRLSPARESGVITETYLLVGASSKLQWQHVDISTCYNILDQAAYGSHRSHCPERRHR